MGGGVAGAPLEGVEALRAEIRDVRRRHAEADALASAYRGAMLAEGFAEATCGVLAASLRLAGALVGLAAFDREGGGCDLVTFEVGGAAGFREGAPALSGPVPERARSSGGVVLDNGPARGPRWWLGTPAPGAPAPEGGPGSAGAGNALASPILEGGAALGLLVLGGKPGGFTPEDARVAPAFAEVLRVVRQHHAALRRTERSERIFRAVVETAQDAILVVDDQARITTWNRRAEAIFGWPAAEILGQPFFRVIPERVRPQHADTIRAFVSGRRDVPAEIREVTGLRRDGTEVPVEVAFSGGLVGGEMIFTAIARDIGGRRRAAVALEAERSKLRSILDALPDGVAILNRDRVAEYVNPALTRQVGLAPGGTCYEHFLGRRDPCPWCRDEQVFAGRQVHYTWNAPDGRTFDVLEVPIRNADGSVSKLELTHDITGHRRATEALAESEARYRRIVEAANEGIWLLDAHGVTTFVNPQMAAVLGRSTEEMVGRPFLDFVPPARHERAVRMFQECRDGVGALNEVVLQRRDGEEVVTLLSSRPVRAEDGTLQGALGMLTDITRLRRVEGERRALEERLRHAQKMEAIGRLAGGVAHDFNNLLSIIASGARFLRDRLDDDDPLRAEAEDVLAAAGRGADLTRQLLAFGRPQSANPRLVEVAGVVGDLEKMLRRLLGSQVELRTELAADVGRVRAEPGHLDQVLVNLAVNARDAMPHGGRLTIQATEVVVDEAWARTRVGLGAGRYVKLAVIDTGVGFGADSMEHLFEPFYTTKKEGGTGLGLATVYGIVKQAGGHIEVASRPGETRFDLYLPRAG